MPTQRYLVTARKYRPQVFSEFVSQDHVTETLKNAIRLDRLAHAYLFSGPRGVGKTTAARVLAKAINCTQPLSERADGAEPCRECDSCRSFEEGRSLGIIEIDAASNNKVDDVRELRDTVRIPPQGSRKKVYIIDEVHMLTQQAFNALLKTLEEPPPYALFIFATTEPNKVLPTILSRCQRFDFRRIPVEDIVAHLRQICDSEGVQADDASLLLIARKGDGALRDALSAFDQAVSLCGMNLQYAELAEALRVVDVDLYFRLSEYIINGDSAGVLKLVDEIVRGGYDLQEFLAGVAEHLRNVLVAATMPDAGLIEATVETRGRFIGLAEHLREADLLRMLTIADDADRSIRNSVQPRLKLELALLKMASLPRAADLRAVLQKIDVLEKQLGNGTGRDESPLAPRPANVHQLRSRQGPGEPGPAPESEPRDRVPERQNTPRTSTPEKSQRPHQSDAAAEPRPQKHDADAGAEPRPQKHNAGDEPREQQRVPKESQPVPRENREASEPPGPGAPGIFGAPALNRRQGPHGTPRGDSEGGKAMFAGSGALATAPDPEDEPHILPAPGVQPEEWEAAVQHVHVDKIHVGALLRHCRPADYRSETLTLAVPNDFHRRMLGSDEAYLAGKLTEKLPLSIAHIRFVVQEDLLPELNEETAAQSDPLEYFNRKREENPIVRAIFDQFGGELVW